MRDRDAWLLAAAAAVSRDSAKVRGSHLSQRSSDLEYPSPHNAVPKGVYFLKTDEAHGGLWNESSYGSRGIEADGAQAGAEDGEQGEDWPFPGER